MKQFIYQILRDKNGDFSIREVTIVLLLLILVASWFGQQFLGKSIPEFMFYSFISLIAAGCFGYSIEKRTSGRASTFRKKDSSV